MTIEAHMHRANGALTTLSDGRHTWTADLEQKAGGKETAPDPHDLLDSALAACTALTLEVYLRRKGWAVTDVHVTIDHIETKAEDGKVHYQLRRNIRIEGEVSQEDRQRLLDIANRCPLHRLLTGQIEIDTVLENA